MRVHDTEIEIKTKRGTIEITEYHDERNNWVGPRHWHARIVVIDDVGPKVINVNRDTQRELFQAMEELKDLFESAPIAVLDAVNA